MSNKQNLKNIKKLREITGVGFKDCKLAIDENNGDIDKSIEYLRNVVAVYSEKKLREEKKIVDKIFKGAKMHP